MNLPLPYKNQSCCQGAKHGSSCFWLHGGVSFRRAPLLAEKLATFLKDPSYSSEEIATKGWHILWPYTSSQRQNSINGGLQRLMSFDESRLRSFSLISSNYRQKNGWVFIYHSSITKIDFCNE